MIDYFVTRAVPAETELVYELLAAAGRHLSSQGFHNWAVPYPRERVAADVGEGAVYLVRAGEPGGAPGATPLATYALRARPVRPYVPAPWAAPAAPARYLNRLAVDPREQGRGLGRWCLAQVARQATAEQAQAVRCDVLAANTKLRLFYERAGYVARGTREHSGWEFVCYEQLLGRSVGEASA